MKPEDSDDPLKCRAFAETLELPSHKHVPGRNERHPEGFLDPIINLAHEVTVSDTAATNIGWLYGLRLLKEGYYWEAHEVLEAVWIRATPNSREKYLVQAVIHVANAAIKDRMEMPKAAIRLAALAEECVAQAYKNQEMYTVMQMRIQEFRELMETHLHKEN